MSERHQEMSVDFRRFSSIARSLKRKSSTAASHFSAFFEFSHSLQEFCTKIMPLILQGFLGAKFRCKNIPSLTGPYRRQKLVTDEAKPWGGLDIQCDIFDFVSELTSRMFLGGEPGHRGAAPSPHVHKNRSTLHDRRRNRSLWPCKVLGRDRTKLFHVKQFCPIETRNRTNHR